MLEWTQEEMAAQGWFLESVGGSVMKFHRAEPAKRRYAALLDQELLFFGHVPCALHCIIRRIKNLPESTAAFKIPAGFLALLTELLCFPERR